ncbi:MAG: LysR family transcriptional regulator, partial [Rhodospirillales bacterium]
MSRRLPSLNALRAFEAAARHLSFTQAAEELNVTQAAVSHQIRGLEDWLGFPLFRRLSRALVLTEAGQLLFPEVREAMDILTTAVNRVQRQDSEGVLTVTTMDSFAQSWLVPRLGRFRQSQPDIDV